MNDLDFQTLQIAQSKAFSQQLQRLADSPGGEALAELAAQYASLADDPSGLLDLGPELVFRMLTVAPQTAELYPRDLLWYLGGECLHFMPDDEIAAFGRLDDSRREAERRGEPFDWAQERARVLGLQ